MKIRGKERIEYDPEWCCDEFQSWVVDGRVFDFDCNNMIITIQQVDYPNIPLYYCPFCGEKIEV